MPRDLGHSTPMSTPLFLIFGIALISIGGVFLYLQMRSAPVGFQDHDGYHPARANDQAVAASSSREASRSQTTVKPPVSYGCDGATLTPALEPANAMRAFSKRSLSVASAANRMALSR